MIVHAGAQNTSFAAGSENLRVLAGLNIPEKQVERRTEGIGDECLRRRESRVQAFLGLPLMERLAAPGQAPDLAVVSMDGGRLQILDRQAPTTDPGDAGARRGPAPASPPERSASEVGVGVEDEDEDEDEANPSRRGHWREDKIGLLMTMTGQEMGRDPCPQIPETFVNPLKIPKLAREIAHGAATGGDGVADPVEDEPACPLEGCAEYTPPKVRLKSMIGTRAKAKRFGAILAAAAFARGFFGAKRKAFVADGAATNWATQRRWFSDFTPILDFIHALSYVFSAAMAARGFSAGWEVYQRWITWVWQGRVAEVIAELKRRQEELGSPEPGGPEAGPRQVVADALSYLENNRDRMRYDEYRRLGLPIVSSHVESTVKRFNRRVKGTEKFWSESGAEALLELRADYLSETEPMEDFWREREANATGRCVYRRSG
jgi:hypothetical protein